jgi:ribulose kinase
MRKFVHDLVVVSLRSAVLFSYAGWLGTVAARFSENGKVEESSPKVDESRHRLAAVAGTSTCYVVNSPEGEFVPGVWGPYKVRLP